MPERPDLRQIASNIREALTDKSRDELLEILVYVFKEYVVEGPPPLLVNQAERVEDLEGLSFGQLIAALQTRLDTPELSLFQVDGDQVSARVGGVMTPIGGAAAASRAPAAPARAPEPEPRRGVQVVEVEGPMQPPAPRPSVDEARTRGRGDLVGEARGAPRPVRGLSMRGRPTGGGAGTMQPPAQAEPAPAPAPKAEPPAEKPADKPREGGEGDDASVRFSLLELD